MFREKYSLKFQIVAGILFGLLNRLFAYLYLVNIPLYLDTIFTVSASFFGVPCGLLSIVFFYVFSLPNIFVGVDFQPSTLFFMICSISMIFIVRAFAQKVKRLSLAHLVLLVLLITFVVAVEGGIIYVFVFNQFAYQEATQVKYLTYALLRQNFSIIIASILPRIPINIVDKSIAVVLGYHFAIEVEKLRKRFLNKETIPKE